MKTHGVRIFDSIGNGLNVKLSEIVEEIPNANGLNWCILFLDGTPNPGKANHIKECKNKINQSKNGSILKWDDICLIGNEFSQIYEIIILGCKSTEFLHRYDNDQEMYECCDIVIELIDCAFWQIFSRDSQLIDRIKRKFKVVELLEPNFEKWGLR